MAKDLRTFLREYEDAFPEETVHIEKEISSKWEVTALVIHADQYWTEPPIFILDNLINHEGVRGQHKSIVNLFASKTRCCWAIGAHEESYARDLFHKGIEQGIEPIVYGIHRDVIRARVHEQSLRTLYHTDRGLFSAGTPSEKQDCLRKGIGGHDLIVHRIYRDVMGSSSQ